MVKTHRDRLVEDHGLDPKWNPRVECACGRQTSADMCVDITALPVEMRSALGLADVDYLCDGCQTRLFRDQIVGEAEFYGLLGAGVQAVVVHTERDREHVQGLAGRALPQRPAVERISADSAPRTWPVIPVKVPRVSHRQSAQWLAYKYTLTNVDQPPERQ